MQIPANQIDRYFNKNSTIPTTFLIYGGEPQQTLTAKLEINSNLRQHGFYDHKRFTIDESQFSWNKIDNACSNLGLFSNKQIIEIYIKQGKLGQQGAASLISFINSKSKDICILLIADKIENNVIKSKWFTTINKIGCIVTAKPIPAHNFQQYVSQQFKAAGFILDNDSELYLSRGYTGNSIGVVQLIKKLKLCFPKGKLNLPDISPHIHLEDSFSVFELIDIAISGDNKKTYKALKSIKNNKIDPIIVIWAIVREVRSLIAIYYMTENGTSFSEACRANGVWSSKAASIQRFITTTSILTLEKLLQNSLTVDIITKNISQGLIWESLLNLCLTLSGTNLCVNLEETTL